MEIDRESIVTLADAGRELVEELEARGYSPAQAVIIFCSGIATILHPKLLDQSVNDVTVAALKHLAKTQ